MSVSVPTAPKDGYQRAILHTSGAILVSEVSTLAHELRNHSEKRSTCDGDTDESLFPTVANNFFHWTKLYNIPTCGRDFPCIQIPFHQCTKRGSFQRSKGRHPHEVLQRSRDDDVLLVFKQGPRVKEGQSVQCKPRYNLPNVILPTSSPPTSISK